MNHLPRETTNFCVVKHKPVRPGLKRIALVSKGEKDDQEDRREN